MKIGDLVLLPDGRHGFYQGPADNDSSHALVVVYEKVPSKQLKRVKEK